MVNGCFEISLGPLEAVVPLDRGALQTRLRPLAGHPERREVRHPERAF